MPIYEFACPYCEQPFDLRFSAPAPVAAAACPRCGTPAPRSLSTFAFRKAATPTAPPSTARVQPEAPLCLRYPNVPLLCHMEPEAAERWVAKSQGQEEQYLERKERQQRAEIDSAVAPSHDDSGPARKPTTHTHAHGQSHAPASG